MKIHLSNKILDEIDLSRYKEYDLGIGNQYFTLRSGQEHYRLLAYLSSLFKDRVFLDVGTSYGCSALALAFNKSNVIHSYDIINFRKESFKKEKNINFYIGDAKIKCRGIRPSIIFMDSEKNDDFEISFIKEIVVTAFSMHGGILIMDDYHEYPIVRECVDFLSKSFKVFDLTKYGHYSGTHLIDINANIEIIET